MTLIESLPDGTLTGQRWCAPYQEFSDRLAALNAEVEYKLCKGLYHGTVVFDNDNRIF